MIIKEKIAMIYDIEIFPNCFHVTIRNTETNEYFKFEISERKYLLNELCDFFKTKNAIFIGYNNSNYDNIIINYILKYQSIMNRKSYSGICKSLFNLSQIIVNENEEERHKIKPFKYTDQFDSIDLATMLFSSKLMVGLKALQMTMNYPNVEEYSGDFIEDIPVDKIDEMISYNINDVDSTTELLYRCSKDLEVRKWIEQEYGINAYSMNSVKIGETILAQTYCKKTGIPYFQLKGMQSPMDYVALKDVIFPFISFSNPILQSVLSDMKAQVVSTRERKGYEKQFVLSNVAYSVGVGGIHSINKPGIFRSSADEYIGHADVTSMYPSLLIVYELTPRHLGKEFHDIYEQIYKERVIAKHSGQKSKNQALKLTLNSVTGKMQEETSWLYDPFNVFRIRINGQLILLMLVERLLNLGCKIIQVNTDGVMYVAKRSLENAVQEAISEVEQISKLKFETGCYEAFYQYAVNDYFGILDGYSETHDPKLIEKKGMFITETNLGKGLAPTIIPKSVIAYFTENKSVKDTIESSNNISDFLMGQRVNKKYHVIYNNKKVANINRYYASTNGYYIFKTDGKRDTTLLSKSGVTILNKFDNKPIKDRHINYLYYISEANKVVHALKTVQLELF